MQITIINATQHNGNRWLVSPAIGFTELGYQVQWLGMQQGGFNLLYKDWTEENPTEIKGINFIPYYTEEEAIKYIKESELIIFNINHGDYSPIGIHGWAQLLNKYRPYDYFVFNGLDCVTQGHSTDTLKEFKYKHYIKREAYPWHKDILPYVGMSTHKEWNKHQDKIISVNCIFGGNYGNNIIGYNRIPIIEAINSNIKDGFTSIGDCYSFDAYMNYISKSKISISCHGAGFACYRDFEILSNDTILALKKMPLIHYNQFKDMESIIFFTTPDELVSKCKQVLDDNKLYTNILNNQKLIVKQYHTPIRRAEQLIEFSKLDLKENYYE